MIKSVYNNCKSTIGEVNIPLGRIHQIYINYKKLQKITKWKCLHLFFLFLKDAKKKTPNKNTTKNNNNKIDITQFNIVSCYMHITLSFVYFNRILFTM